MEGREGERLKEVYPNVVINVKKKKKKKTPLTLSLLRVTLLILVWPNDFTYQTETSEGLEGSEGYVEQRSTYELLVFT